jgi:hypothetical protein
VIDYSLWYALTDSEFINKITNIPTTSYTLDVSTLIAGRYYKLKVQSRNSVGLSLDSAEIIILAARIADPPTSVVTTINKPNVIINW